jgi:hypothetical protein
LLTAGSLGVEKIQENGLIRLPGGRLGFGQIIQPTDIQGHDDSSFPGWVLRPPLPKI